MSIQPSQSPPGAGDPRVHLVLVGMMGAGKTTIGRLLAERWGVTYADNDEELRRLTGRDPAETARALGAVALHRVEHDILVAAVRRCDGAVVGAPGSVALDASADALLADQRVVWLRARPGTLLARLSHGPARPLLGKDPAAALTLLMREREPGFERLADAIVDVDGLDAEVAVDTVARAVGRR
ncbi:MAG: shikimate kinase [Candidatus Dormibacteria bacterium]